ncbi:MAG TPA: cytochrome ubiquinol oxidase subunit I [Solirubrobacteraceae bacterium]|nr:cytochrome ubiquinol oxidase subunit I [Solirubrobacteraceae bacterium]
MSSYVLVDRLQFAFTVTFHYMFPILTMGLGLFIAYLKSVSYLGRPDRRLRLLRRTDDQRDAHESAARFWAKIFAVTFAVGVVTGIPLEFEFGTNWAAFSNYAGGVIGQTLAMEGTFSFLLESAFLGVFLYGMNRVGPRAHWISALAIFVGSWLSGFFIIATDAFMQHPAGYTGTGKSVHLKSFWALLTNPWLIWQYPHNMSGAALTGAFVLAAMGAFYLLLGRHEHFARLCVTVGVVGALIFGILQIFPTGDQSAKNVYHDQPVTFASMEGAFKTEQGAPLVIIGNPNTQTRQLEDTIALPHFLSFLTTHHFTSVVRGLDSFPTSLWPSSVPLVYYAYHIMVGLGTLLALLAVIATYLLWRRKLFSNRKVLWALMIAFPFTYIANIAGWITAEVGRQPWVAYGLLRTSAGASPSQSVPAGIGIFTLLGFLGIYIFIAMLYVLLIVRIIARGPEDVRATPPSTVAATAGA